MNKLVLLDAYALIYRAFYALMRSPRINSKGFNTSTVFGFVNTLKEILDKEKPTHIGIAFDPKGPTFRHEAFPQYKAQREKTPEGIQESVPIIKDIIRAFNITIFEEPGYEADDVIGTLATRAAAIGFETFMVTPDKDYCQLVTNNIRIIRPSHGKSQAEILGPTEVNQKYSLSSPLQVIDMLGLMGDSADNVPGCPNVGEKTAVSLINKFGSIEGIYEHIEEVKGKLQENLIQNKEQVLFSKFLVTIKTDVPILFDEEQVRLKEIDKTKVRKIFEELEFRSLLKSICGVEEKSEPKGPVQLDLFGNFSGESPTDSKKTNLSASKTIQARYEIADTKEKRESFLKKIQEEKTVGLAIATTSTVAIDAKIIGFSLASSDGHTIYIPFKENDADAVNYIRAILSDKNTTKVGFNLKYVLLVLRRYNIELKGKLFDVMLAHYVIQPEQKHFLASMADTYLHSDTINIDSFFSGML